MRLARVVGNVVSTIKDEGYKGQKLMIVEYLNEHGQPEGARQIAFDCADAGVGDELFHGASVFSSVGDEAVALPRDRVAEG